MDQHAAWEREYAELRGIPTSTRTRPSSAIMRLMGYIDQDNLRPLRILDIGCGAGRNTLYLAKQGHQITAIDFADTALDILRKKVVDQALDKQVTALHHDLTKPLPFANGAFDIVIDITTSTALQPQAMPHLIAELRRVLTTDGLVLSYVQSRDDGYLQASAPGQDHYTLPSSGIVDQTWTEEDLRRLYNQWKIIELSKNTITDSLYGKDYTRRLWWLLARKVS